MRIIFSRKGFDSSAGGFPNLIFPDGTMYMIPIPDKNSSISYKDLNFFYEKDSIQKILNDLTRNRIKLKGKTKYCDYKKEKFKCHLDPMEVRESQFHGIAFGQTGGMASHLIKSGINKGDIFLFFSWFKKIEKVKKAWQYKKSFPDIHAVWMIMEVGEIIRIEPERIKDILNIFPFLKKHPHIKIKNKSPNAIFLSRRWKKLKFQESLILTDLLDYKGRSYWRLPKYFKQPQAFSFLKDFTLDDQDVLIKSPGRGQEFVLDIEKVKPPEKEQILGFIYSLF